MNMQGLFLQWVVLYFMFFDVLIVCVCICATINYTWEVYFMLQDWKPHFNCQKQFPSRPQIFSSARAFIFLFHKCRYLFVNFTMYKYTAAAWFADCRRVACSWGDVHLVMRTDPLRCAASCKSFGCMTFVAWRHLHKLQLDFFLRQNVFVVGLVCEDSWWSRMTQYVQITDKLNRFRFL